MKGISHFGLCRLAGAGAFMLVMFAPAIHAQRTWRPTVSGASPNVVQIGGIITISGTDLNPPGWRARLRYVSKYSGNTTTVDNVGGTATTLTFAAPEMRETGMAVEWTVWIDTTARVNPIPLAEQSRAVPATIVVQGPPDLTFPGPTVGADVGAPFPIMQLGNGGAVLKGKFLRRNSMPTLSHGGTPLTVLQHTFNESATLYTLAGSGGGADQLVFTPPTQKRSGWLVVDNSLGRDSAFVTFTPAPVIQEIRLQEGTTTKPLSPTNQLQRGRTYVIRGTNLSVTHDAPTGTSIKRGLARLGTTDIAPIFASDTNLVFKVPDNFASSSGVLSAVTVAGTTALGTFLIANQVAAINVASLNVSSAALVSGGEIVILATLAIPANTDADQLGNLRVTLASGSPGVVNLKNPYPVNKSGPTEVRIAAGSVQSPMAFSLIVAHDSYINGQNTTTQPLALTVRPPHPTALTAGVGPVYSGTTRNFDVRLDGSVNAAAGIFAYVTSSNPNIVSVPPTIMLNGDKSSFNGIIAPQLQPTTVTVTVTLDGVSASLPLNINVPVVQRVEIIPATALPGDRVTVQAFLSGTLAPGGFPGFNISDTALTFANSTGRQPPPNALLLEVTRGLSTQRSVIVSASSGGVTKADTIMLTPIVISDFVSTPASGRTGTTLSATTLLSAAPTVPMSLRYTSGDTAYATVPTTATAVSSTSRVISIQLRGTPTTPRQIPITAILSSGSVIVSQRTTIITVTP